MGVLGIILVYAVMVALCIFGLWQWRSVESDFMEQGFGCTYVILSVLAIICFSIGVFTGQV